MKLSFKKKIQATKKFSYLIKQAQHSAVYGKVYQKQLYQLLV